ncbi:tyrosine-protein phosphatase [Saccharopolyspora erythraea]|uniref:tyrosine-protein phosphatase n=1 Tax=Saccharopolyspora erythraea TaxID=1836 RepID=UPI001BAC6BB4|nr:tyrosine-protein phosphatase [Saccharopolyspora erythraea]QUH01303.1 tyrosine-protein phosphatase [Saccharopolyspora erythraea]
MPTTEHEALDGLVNLRDLGGVPVEEGVATAAGVVLRSDAPHAGDRTPEMPAQWPPKVVVDLRDPSELAGKPHPLAEVARVHRVPLLEEERGGGGGADDTRHALTALYQRMLDRAAKKLVEVFRIVLESDGPVLIHCAAGKDRTGVASAMLLSAAGVRRDAIVADYVLTDQNMPRVLQRLSVDPQLPPGVDEEMVRQLISAPAEAIESVLDRFDEHEGGAAGWLLAHDVTQAEVDRWRERFLAADG